MTRPMIPHGPRALLFAFALLIALVGTACGSSQKQRITDPTELMRAHRHTAAPDGKRHATSGKASWYGKKFHGRKTASGERYDMYALTAAHRTLPFHSLVRVTDPHTRKSVVVRITDRGPFTKGRIIDLSYGAAKDLGMIKAGVKPVYIEVLRWGRGQ